MRKKLQPSNNFGQRKLQWQYTTFCLCKTHIEYTLLAIDIDFYINDLNLWSAVGTTQSPVHLYYFLLRVKQIIILRFEFVLLCLMVDSVIQISLLNVLPKTIGGGSHNRFCGRKQIFLDLFYNHTNNTSCSYTNQLCYHPVGSQGKFRLFRGCP